MRLLSYIQINKASHVGSLHSATGVSMGGSFALKLIPTLACPVLGPMR